MARHDDPDGMLTWRGAATVDAAVARVKRGERVAIALPANFHHALVARLDAGPRGPVRQVAEQGGGELLRVVAAIPGLDCIAALADAAAEHRCTVRLLDPAAIVVDPPARPA